MNTVKWWSHIGIVIALQLTSPGSEENSQQYPEGSTMKHFGSLMALASLSVIVVVVASLAFRPQQLIAFASVPARPALYLRDQSIAMLGNERVQAKLLTANRGINQKGQYSVVGVRDLTGDERQSVAAGVRQAEQWQNCGLRADGTIVWQFMPLVMEEL